MPEDAFSVADLGKIIAKTLRLKPGDVVELQKNRLDPDQLKIVKVEAGKGGTR